MTEFDLVSLFSTARLAPYYVEGENFEQAFSRYQWNIRLAEALLPALHYLEVGLRNKLNGLICQHYGHDWLIKRPAVLLSPEQNRILDEMRERYMREKQRQPNHDDIVARMGFGFWYAYFHKRFDPILWHRKKSIFKVFPFLPAHKHSRKYIQSHLGSIKDMRNRIAHHEPVWNTNPCLIDVHKSCIDLITAMSPDAAHRLNQIDRLITVWSQK